MMRWGFFLLLALSGLANAMPKIDDPAGPLTRAETLRALIAISGWMDKAEELCLMKDSSDCAVTVRVSVPAAGGHPSCVVKTTAITDVQVRNVYCQVVQQASFPAKKQGSAFTLLFYGRSTPPPSLPCGNPGAVRDEAHVTPCFDLYNDQLTTLYRQALKDHPDMHGVITFNLQIRSSGIAYGVDVVNADPSLDPGFVDAVTSLVKSMDFGLAADDATVQHGYNFYP